MHGERTSAERMCVLRWWAPFRPGTYGITWSGAWTTWGRPASRTTELAMPSSWSREWSLSCGACTRKLSPSGSRSKSRSRRGAPPLVW